jgi:acetyl-CoA acetyltransferase
MVCEGLGPVLQSAGQQALAMADAKLSDIQHFEGYDAASIHLILQMEGYGLIERGTGLEFFKEGRAAIGGDLPVNVAGGMLSGSYMMGWNHVAETVRQIRHEAGARQIEDLQTSMTSLAQTDQAHPIIFRRGA